MILEDEKEEETKRENSRGEKFNIVVEINFVILHFVSIFVVVVVPLWLHMESSSSSPSSRASWVVFNDFRIPYSMEYSIWKDIQWWMRDCICERINNILWTFCLFYRKVYVISWSVRTSWFLYRYIQVSSVILPSCDSSLLLLFTRRSPLLHWVYPSFSLHQPFITSCLLFSTLNILKCGYHKKVLIKTGI